MSRSSASAAPGTSKTLRDYQSAAVDSVLQWWERGKAHPLVVAPTGSGKSLMIAALCCRAVAIDPGVRIVVLAHRKELVTQNAAELADEAPGLDVGLYSAGAGRRELDCQITFGGIQSIARRADRLGRVDFVVVDEAHMIPRNSATRYGQFLFALEEVNPKCKRVGFTATPYRLDSGRLDSGDGALFDGVSYDIAVPMLIERGYLSAVVSKGGVKDIDLSGVRKRGGEFAAGQMQSAAMRIAQSIVDEACALGESRAGWMVFASGVEHAEQMAAMFRARGVPTETVTGATQDRDAILGAFRRRELRCLVNVDVLTTGFNAPHVDMVVLARATESAALYVQMVGRGMRTSPGKANCLLLDYGGNVLRHGPIDDVRAHGKDASVEPGEPPARQCESCGGLCHASLRECPYCGAEFPAPEQGKDLEAEAYDGAVIGRQNHRPKELLVSSVRYARHRKPGKPDSVRVEYRCGLHVYREWICPEHEGYARVKYMQWCRKTGVEPCESVEEHLASNPPDVQTITIKEDGRHAEVVARTVRRAAPGSETVAVA